MIKKSLFILLLIANTILFAQDQNVFLTRKYWSNNPSIEQVEKEIKNGADPSALDKYQFDAVSWAILEKTSNKTILHLLSKKGNEVNKLTHDGRTYIFWAAYKNNLELMNHLIKHGAKTDIIDQHGYSLVNFCAVTGQTNTEIYDFCIANGADLKKERNKLGANPLLLLMPFIKEIKLIDYFTSKGLNIKSTDNEGNNAFNYACKTGNKSIISYLLKKEISPFSNDHNAVIFAAQGTRKTKNNISFFHFLDSLGIRLNTFDQDGQNALHILSKKSKDTVLLNYLIYKGIKFNVRDKDGNICFSNAIKRNNIELIKYFSKKSPESVNYIDNEGNNIIHLAIQRKKIDIISLAINLIPSLINQKNNDGLTPLHLSCMKAEDEEIIKMLILMGADIKIKTDFGETAFDLAKENEKLIKTNADVEFLKHSK